MSDNNRTTDIYPYYECEGDLLNERIIFIDGKITSDVARKFEKEILYLLIKDKTKPINVLVNSKGGDANSGLMICDIVRDSPAPVRTICNGQAQSIAAIIVASGNGGSYILTNSEIMIHDPYVKAVITGDEPSLQSIVDCISDTKMRISKILSNKTKKSIDEIHKSLCFEHYLTAEESVEFGLCDKIINFDEIINGIN